MTRLPQILISSEVLGDAVVGTLVSPVEMFKEPLWVIQLAEEVDYGPFKLKYLVLRKTQFKEVIVNELPRVGT